MIYFGHLVEREELVRLGEGEVATLPRQDGAAREALPEKLHTKWAQRWAQVAALRPERYRSGWRRVAPCTRRTS